MAQPPHLSRIHIQGYVSDTLGESTRPRSAHREYGGCRLLSGEVSVPQLDEQSYLLNRESACRELAERSSDPGARKAHLEMADRYAERAALVGRPILHAMG